MPRSIATLTILPGSPEINKKMPGAANILCTNVQGCPGGWSGGRGKN